MSDLYKTIEKPSEETLFKDKNSKFYGYALPVSSIEDVKNKLEEIQKKHPNAGHYCYAYQIGIEEIQYRVNDDGEPNNSAGMPIYGQIQSFDVTNVLVISVRYFGGVKLGVSGLINAYRTSAKLSLEAANIKEKTIKLYFKLIFDYDLMSKVMRYIKENNLEIINQELALDCKYVVAIRKKHANKVFNFFKQLYKVEVEKLDSNSI
ncbi:MAG: YigZ family protein [Flavobacteriaceae bacterium]|nr:YigZ family protein [Flavobacteriaceae bacterium]